MPDKHGFRGLSQKLLSYATKHYQTALNDLQAPTAAGLYNPSASYNPTSQTPYDPSSMLAAFAPYMAQPHAAASAAPPPQFPAGAPPPPPGSHVPPPPPPSHALFPPEALRQIPTRASSARAKIGPTAVLEARKGLSKVLDATSIHDIHTFGEQLRRSNLAAVEPNWRNDDRLPVFAVSYTQVNPPQGRFKFGDEQWRCLLALVEQLAASGVTRFRLWCDQCLWLRDASQGGWAHTGLLPYVLWPVLSLGRKKKGGDRSVETDQRMWPFLEEVAGLWGLGVLFAREMREVDPNSGWRMWPSYCIREKFEPEFGAYLLLMNVFHGAVDSLNTGWQEDVVELKEMATANVAVGGTELFLGSDWKQRLASANVNVKPSYQFLSDLALPIKSQFLGGVNVYIDGSRTLMGGSWHGVREWLSGNDVGIASVPNETDIMIIAVGIEKVHVMSDIGEFALLMKGDMQHAIWLLIAMDGPTSNFSRGKVAWTKVMTGEGSCVLSDAVASSNVLVVSQVLSAELQRRVKVFSVVSTNNAIEWE